MENIGVEIIQLNELVADRATAIALKYRRNFPFKHHARDYIIGASALEQKARLVTYNLDDFTWLTEEGGSASTPEEVVAGTLK